MPGRTDKSAPAATFIDLRQDMVVGVDVFKKTTQCAVNRLDQPVKLPIRDLHLPFVLAWYANASAHPEVTIEGPKAKELIERIQLPRSAIAHAVQDTAVSIKFEATNDRWTTMSRVRTLATHLASIGLPGNSTVELSMIAANGAPEGRMRFRGIIANSEWHITESHPGVTAAFIRNALQLASHAEGGVRIEGLSANLAQESLELFDAEWGPLYRHTMPVLEEGDLVTTAQDTEMMHLFARNYFCLQFGEAWSSVPVDEDVRAKVQRKKSRHALASRTIFESPSGRKFTVATVNTLGEDTLEEWEALDEEARDLGARRIGEFSCSQFGSFVFRYYLMPELECRLVIYRGDMPMTMVEFITDFADGASLSTSKQPGSGDDLQRQIFRTRIPHASLGAMFGAHIDRCTQMKDEHNGFLPFNGTLDECAKRFEEGLLRQQAKP